MKRLLIATKNKGKLVEFQKFFSDLNAELVLLTDVGISQDVEEDGKTYEENSKKKALFYATVSNLPAIADDGGIEIAALDNAPGVKSRRWLGHVASDDELIAHMYQVAASLPDENRKAAFVTVVSFALPNGQVWSSTGRIDGIIAKTPLMHKVTGYPYRAFFYVPKLKKYYQDEILSDEEQRLYNHRYQAVQLLKPIIVQQLTTYREKRS